MFASFPSSSYTEKKTSALEQHRLNGPQHRGQAKIPELREVPEGTDGREEMDTPPPSSSKSKPISSLAELTSDSVESEQEELDPVRDAD